MFDEWTDERGVAILGVIAHSKKVKLCIDVQFLEGKGPNNGVEHTKVASAMIAGLTTVAIHLDPVGLCIIDEGSVMVAKGNHIFFSLRVFQMCGKIGTSTHAPKTMILKVHKAWLNGGRTGNLPIQRCSSVSHYAPHLKWSSEAILFSGRHSHKCSACIE